MNRDDRGFTLVELMIVVTIISIVAAIAIPSLLRSKMTSNHGNAGAALKTLVTQETIWRSLDIDKNGAADYWVRDLRALYAARSGSGTLIALIDAAFANADTSAPSLYGYSGEAPLAGSAKHGYLYGSIAGYRDGNSVVGADPATGLDTTATNLHSGVFGFTAFPATYGNGCVLQFIVNQDGVIWQKDVGNSTPVAAYPAAPSSESPPWSQFGG